MADSVHIIYEDNHIMVVVKPVGIPVQADENEDADLLTHLKEMRRVREQKTGNVFLGLVHRLDRMVGGVMVFAKTSKAASRLSEQVRSRSMGKMYLAVLHGNPPAEGFLEDYLLKDSRTNISRVVKSGTAGAKDARLRYRKLAAVSGFSLAQIALETGRSHQIRVQFSSRGWPLVGDIKYGNEHGTTDGPALWAYELQLEHPTTKEKMVFTQLPPRAGIWKEFTEVLS